MFPHPYSYAIAPHPASGKGPPGQMMTYLPFVAPLQLPSTAKPRTDASRVKQSIAAVKIQRAFRSFIDRKRLRALVPKLRGEFGLSLVDVIILDFLAFNFLPDLILNTVQDLKDKATSRRQQKTPISITSPKSPSNSISRDSSMSRSLTSIFPKNQVFKEPEIVRTRSRLFSVSNMRQTQSYYNSFPVSRALDVFLSGIFEMIIKIITYDCISSCFDDLMKREERGELQVVRLKADSLFDVYDALIYSFVWENIVDLFLL
ncbi:hypothetical protein RCL1_006275 [Eukaryota sp. TZLM3-RCL]